MSVRSALAAVLIPMMIGALFAFPAGQASKKKPPAQSDQTIRVAVEMVSLPVVATTREGKRVTDLTQQDFDVLEDGAPQEIAGFAATDEPISVALAIDSSGSTEQRLARMQNEAIRFVNQLHPDDEVAVMGFSEDVNLFTDFSIDRDRNAYGIKETRGGGWTVLYEAVWLALEEVLKPKKERTALVLFTDGVDTASHKVTEKETLALASETKATIYSIYFNTEEDQWRRATGGTPTVGGIPLPGGPPVIRTMPPVYGPGGAGTTRGEYTAGRDYLRKLADNSGGLVFDALAMQDLAPAFEEIAKELASQYSIGYYSTNQKHDGKFRKIEVKVKRPGVVARTKKGYTARKDAKK
jgi:VWFA-related protein